MDADRFDRLTRDLIIERSRRTLLASGLAGVLGILGQPDPEARRRKHKKKRRRPKVKPTPSPTPPPDPNRCMTNVCTAPAPPCGPLERDCRCVGPGPVGWCVRFAEAPLSCELTGSDGCPEWQRCLETCATFAPHRCLTPCV